MVGKPTRVCENAKYIANSKQTFDRISNLQWQVNSLQQQIGSCQRQISTCFHITGYLQRGLYKASAATSAKNATPLVWNLFLILVMILRCKVDISVMKWIIKKIIRISKFRLIFKTVMIGLLESLLDYLRYTYYRKASFFERHYSGL